MAAPLTTRIKTHIHHLFNQVTSRTSSASMLMKGSETCKAHMLSIIGEITGSMDNAASWPTMSSYHGMENNKVKSDTF